MANGEQYEFGKEIGEMQGDIRGLHSKIDALQSTMVSFTQGIGSRVQEHGESISAINANVTTIKSDLDRAHGKIGEHIKNHWQWVGVLICLMTIFGFLMKGIK